MGKNLTRVLRNCEHCHKPFNPPLAEIKRGAGKYCSRKCMAMHRYNGHILDRICEFCGKPFQAQLNAVEKGNGRFCSRKCGTSARTSHIENACIVCGKTFRMFPSQSRKCCSRTCAAIERRGAKNGRWVGGKKCYRGANWVEQRKLAYERDGGFCQICHHKPKKGDYKNSVHHIKPYRLFNGDYISANDLKNLITLCRKCHPKAELGSVAVPVRLF